MRLFECENCHSVFIVNEADQRIQSGDYHTEETMDCGLCHADMIRIDSAKSEKEGAFKWKR